MSGKVDNKKSVAHLYLLLYVLLKNKMTLDQEQMLDIDPSDVGNLAALVFQPHYVAGHSGKMFRGKNLVRALRLQNPAVAELAVPKGMSNQEFMFWLEQQVATFGLWILVKSERDKMRWN